MKFLAILFMLIIVPCHVYAVASGLPGHEMSLWWALPFVGILGSIAIFPLTAIHFWEHHYGKVALAWALLSIVSLLIFYGLSAGGVAICATLFHHYLPFIILLGVLYTVAAGIHIEIKTHATPLFNTALLAVGTFLAGWIGTTGASMLLIRPLIQINKDRKTRVHQMIFFIFLVSNMGGALTPLGDPPLFLGFLNGVSFFWTIRHLAPELVIVSVPLLILFYVVDSYFVHKEKLSFRHEWPKVKFEGNINSLFFLGVIGLVLLSGVWKPDVSFEYMDVSFELQNLVRDIGLVLLGIFSWFLTPNEIYKKNHFSWEPFKEIIKIFFGIFMTVIPVIAILSAGQEGALSSLVSLTMKDGMPNNGMYFWLTGLLSSFLDNAPTYLVFFYVAGGDAPTLMTALRQTLEAISLGSVFLGAMTYIGNAPNFMVKAIAESQKIEMPSFLGYMIWSITILIPLFLVLVWIWF